MLYLKVSPSSTLEILPEFICHSIFLKSGSFMNLQREFTLYSQPLIDVSINTLKLRIWSITHIPPKPVLTLWHRRNAVDGGGQHLSWIWRPVNLQRHFAASDADSSPARCGFTLTWWAGGWRYTITPKLPVPTQIGQLSTSSKSRWSKPEGSGARLASSP